MQHNCKINLWKYWFQLHYFYEVFYIKWIHVLKLNVLGYSCAEYNVGGDVIQENYDTSCEQSTPPCPFQYSSDEVYKCEFISDTNSTTMYCLLVNIIILEQIY